ncbi:MAG: beta-ketoacyl-[acyl-carrier-protein] synthase family protein [Deltaproteobacteria bacterium]|nr:beta-ketoacyl-[acyl-carrier-protein] synthase family protein [Deltaproteobacteria bacterium]
MRRVAITGFGVVSPIGVGADAFFASLTRGDSGIRRITRFDVSTFEVQLAGEVKEELELPAEVAEVAAHDPKVGFAYEACRQALEQSAVVRLGQESLLHLGTSLEVFDLSKAIHGGKLDFHEVARRCLQGEGPPVQVPLDTAARLISASFGLPEQVLVNCSACAAGAQAIGQGFRAVRSGRVDRAVCGAFDSMINPLGVGGFQLLGALTTDNARGAHACRPFDASRSGTVLGEGAAIAVLEPLEQARAQGRTILAELCGYGSSLDASSLSAPDPEGKGAERAMASALQDAGIDGAAIGHINVHGTGTQLNDEIEAMAIRRLFSATWQRIPISATKSMTGHLIAAAGAVELGACLLAIGRGVLPPNPCLQSVGPGCELDHVTAPGRGFDGEYVLTNSFGFGGQNATLVLRRAMK